MGCHFLLQGIFPTQGLNLSLPHCRQTLYPLSIWITTNFGKFFKRWEYQATFSASWEICMQVKKQQLQPDMEEQTGSKSGKEYVKAIYCHRGYLTYLQSSVQFSRSVVSDSLRPHESQHARPPCPSPAPGVHSNSWRVQQVKYQAGWSKSWTQNCQEKYQ